MLNVSAWLALCGQLARQKRQLSFVLRVFESFWLVFKRLRLSVCLYLVVLWVVGTCSLFNVGTAAHYKARVRESELKVQEDRA